MAYLTVNPSDNNVINVSEIPNADEDRTLLYGYTSERNSFHVYLKDGLIHRAIYDQNGYVIVHNYGASKEWDVYSLYPDKRVYSESTDEDFAKILLLHGATPSFLHPEPENAVLRAAKHGGFHGEHNF